MFQKFKNKFATELEEIDKKSPLEGKELDKLMKYYDKMPRLLTALRGKFTKSEIEEGAKDAKSLGAQVSYILDEWIDLEDELCAIHWRVIPPERVCWMIVQTERTLEHMNDYLSGNCMSLHGNETQ